MGMLGLKQLKLKKDAVPTVIDRGLPKGSGQVFGEKSFERKKTNFETKFQSKFFGYQCGSPKKLSPEKRYGAFSKCHIPEVSEIIHLLNPLAC